MRLKCLYVFCFEYYVFSFYIGNHAAGNGALTVEEFDLAANIQAHYVYEVMGLCFGKAVLALGYVITVKSW